MKIELVTSFLIFFMTFCCPNPNELFGQKKFIYQENGRLYYPNGEEVSLWGVNFQPNLSWEYRSRYKPLGIQLETEVLKRNANEGFDEIQQLNCNLIRCHLTPADFTDDKGNLVETIYLNILDYMVAEASKRGIYVYLAFINHMNNGYVSNSYMNNFKREEWIYNENSVKYSKTYIKQLLNRKNPYSGLLYKNDPTIAVWEVINEPGYYSYEEIKGSAYYSIFQDWLKENNKEDNENNYFIYRKSLVLNYINGMYDHMKGVGTSQPIVWNCNWHKMLHDHEDVFEAIGESKVEVVSFCNYPGQNECKNPYYLHPEDLSNYDFTSFFNNAYSQREWYLWTLETPFMNKAKVVYEFETFYNQSAYLYPVMANLFRSLGVQMAAMWTYCFPGYAQYHSGSHFLSLTCTPQKSASFIVAGEIFKSIPLYEKFNVKSPVEKITNNYAYSYKNNNSVFVSENKYFHSRDMMGWEVIKPAKNINEIAGFGNSPLVSYDGTGMYFVKISDNLINISIKPDAKWSSEPWQQWKYQRMVTELDYNAKHLFEIKLSKWNSNNCKVYRIADGRREKVSLNDVTLKFNVTPGEYIVTR